jgi:hypothetical protein
LGPILFLCFINELPRATDLFSVLYADDTTGLDFDPLYISFFHSHLLYCTNIYSCTSQTNINKIFLLQKKAIRIITNSSYTSRTAPLFASLNILPLEKVITHAKLSFMHTVYYGTAPTSFNNIWQTKAQCNPELNLRNATDVPFPQIDLFKRMPIYSLPSVWNSYDIVRYYANRTTFSIALHELLHAIEVQEEA